MFIKSYSNDNKPDKYNIYYNKIKIYKKLLPDYINKSILSLIF